MRNCLQLLVLFILYLTLPHTGCTFQLQLLLVHQLALVQLSICLGKGISMLQGMMMFQLSTSLLKHAELQVCLEKEISDARAGDIRVPPSAPNVVDMPMMGAFVNPAVDLNEANVDKLSLAAKDFAASGGLAKLNSTSVAAPSLVPIRDVLAKVLNLVSPLPANAPFTSFPMSTD
jgi:hypothetical protein